MMAIDDLRLLEDYLPLDDLNASRRGRSCTRGGAARIGCESHAVACNPLTHEYRGTDH